MQRFNKALKDNTIALQTVLKSLYKRREIENGAIEGRTLDKIKQSLVNNRWASDKITEFDMLMILSTSSKDSLLSRTSYEGIPLSCIKERKISSQEDLDNWKVKNSATQILSKEIVSMMNIQLQISTMKNIFTKKGSFSGTLDDFLQLIASLTDEDSYTDMLGLSTSLLKYKTNTNC